MAIEGAGIRRFAPLRARERDRHAGEQHEAGRAQVGDPAGEELLGRQRRADDEERGAVLGDRPAL
ncbi:MAG TPA: hypothetical protein VIK91_20850 [Nannocystis sp.]